MIPEGNGNYLISNLGRVKSLERFVDSRHGALTRKKKAKIIIGRSNQDGYRQVLIYPTPNIKDRKTRTVHRLVAEAFISNPNNHPQVLHKDDDKWNPMVDNLYWGTPLDNSRDAVDRDRVASGMDNPRAKLNNEQVIEIFKRASNGESARKIAADFGVYYTIVYKIRNGVNWRRITAPFK